jgi:hypothetical protein
VASYTSAKWTSRKNSRLEPAQLEQRRTEIDDTVDGLCLFRGSRLRRPIVTIGGDKARGWFWAHRIPYKECEKSAAWRLALDRYGPFNL